jgi:hypothetical protein
MFKWEYDVQLKQQGDYLVWITCLLAGYQDQIIAEIIKKGYTVSVPNKDTPIVYEPKLNLASALLSIRVQSNDPNTTTAILNTDIQTIMADKKLKSFSVIVAERISSCWAGSNFELSKEKSETESKE